MLLTTILTLLLTAPPAKAVPNNSIKTLSINSTSIADKSNKILVSPNIVTSILFSSPIDLESVIIGDTNRFDTLPFGDQQLNVKALTNEMGYETNMYVRAKNGQVMSFWLAIADKSKANPVIKVQLESDVLGNGAKSAMPADENACREALDKATLALLKNAAEGISYKHVDKRAVFDEVILKVLDFNKIGNRGILRFAVENRSRYAWSAGEVRLSVADGRKEAETIDASQYFNMPTINTDEELFGAMIFYLRDLSTQAKFTLQVFERKGSRNPEVSGLRF